MAAQPSTESSTVEDYLEIILQLIDTKGYARVADIAGGLSISQASVSNMMRRLDDKGLLKYEKYRGMTLTSEGERLAKRIVKRHSILEEFLALLGAYADVEGMEHHVSSGTLRGLEQIIEELKKNPKMGDRVRSAVSREQH